MLLAITCLLAMIGILAIYAKLKTAKKAAAAELNKVASEISPTTPPAA